MTTTNFKGIEIEYSKLTGCAKAIVPTVTNKIINGRVELVTENQIIRGQLNDVKRIITKTKS